MTNTTTRPDYCPRCERITIMQVHIIGHEWALWCPEHHDYVARGDDSPCPTVRVEDGHVVAGAH